MSVETFNSRDLRNAFGFFATGITVVTAFDPQGAAVGVTANSFTSLSLDPPLVLWSIGRQSAKFDVFSRTPSFVISILNAEGEHLSRSFAARGPHRADMRATIETELGPPALADALAIFECETYARYDGGDHLILVGQVRRFAYAQDETRKPLVFYRGCYGTTEG